jgi:tetratricopeptide (TPR) repeat protein
MSSDRIARLHEQASENYLNGDYAGALQAWRDVLALDPANEAALDGVRMAAQFVERDETPVAAASPEIERELDQGLNILNGLGAAARPPAPRSSSAAAPAAAPSRDPSATMILDRSEIEAAIGRKPAPPAEASAETPAAVVVSDTERQSEGIDFGDLAEVPPIPLGAPLGAPGGDALPKDEPEGWAQPAREAPAFGLAPAAAAAPLPGSAAAVELKRRIADLLAQARTKADAGEREEALTILGRVSILNEDNDEAQQLRTLLEADSHNALDRVEQAIIEGVQALEADDLDGAEKLFGEALSVVPEHREALHYMETIAARRGPPRRRHPKRSTRISSKDPFLTATCPRRRTSRPPTPRRRRPSRSRVKRAYRRRGARRVRRAARSRRIRPRPPHLGASRCSRRGSSSWGFARWRSPPRSSSCRA